MEEEKQPKTIDYNNKETDHQEKLGDFDDNEWKDKKIIKPKKDDE